MIQSSELIVEPSFPFGMATVISFACFYTVEPIPRTATGASSAPDPFV